MLDGAEFNGLAQSCAITEEVGVAVGEMSVNGLKVRGPITEGLEFGFLEERRAKNERLRIKQNVAEQQSCEKSLSCPHERVVNGFHHHLPRGGSFPDADTCIRVG